MTTPPATSGPSLRRLPVVATLMAAAVVLLAVGAVLLPAGFDLFRRQQGILLVLDPLGEERSGSIFAPLAEWLSVETGLHLEPAVVTTPAALAAYPRGDVTAIFCPDALALRLPDDEFQALARATRRAPQNLPPRSVLVSRRNVARQDRPWFSASERTILGDTLTLVALGAILADGVGEKSLRSWSELGCASGPDPFDHAPALHAARLGCFDHAIVRQWTAEAFFATGLLPPGEWEVRSLGAPVPDFVVLAARRLSAADRGRLRRALLRLGVAGEVRQPLRTSVLTALDRIGIAGFALLLQPELERYRRSYAGGWPTPER